MNYEKTVDNFFIDKIKNICYDFSGLFSIFFKIC